MSRKNTYHPIGVIAAILAWVIPGAGHIYLGRVKRGLIIFVTVTVTFWVGMALGGAMTVDQAAEPWWFTADMLTGASGVIGWQIQQHALRGVGQTVAISQDGPTPRTMEQALAEAKLDLVAPTDTVARAYAGVAGMINLLCIFDALILALMGQTGEQPPADGSAGSSPAGSGQALPVNRGGRA